MGKAAKDEATWELIQGLGILVHPSLPWWAYLQPTSFIRMIFFSLSWVGVAFHQTELSALSWPLEGVRIWKLTRTYPSKKTTFILFTHARMLSCHTALAGNTQHPIRYESPLRGSDDSFSPTCPGTTRTSLPRKLKLFIYEYHFYYQTSAYLFLSNKKCNRFE